MPNGEEKLINAKVYFEGDEKNVVRSDENGLYAIDALQEGEQVLVAEKEGFAKYEEIMFVVKGENQELNLELEAIEPIVPSVE